MARTTEVLRRRMGPVGLGRRARAVGEHQDASIEEAMKMLKKIEGTGRLALAGAVGLLVVAFLGGAALAAAENTGYVEGLALAFSTISTTGFGPGPQTTLGLTLTMLVFAVGAACWLAILVAAFGSGMCRYAAAVSPGNGLHRFDMERWSLRLFGRREEGRG